MENSTHLYDKFGPEFYDVVRLHKTRLAFITQEYDVVIFMARKAICFYKALVINGEIDPPKSIVTSSRILTYNCDHLKGKRIALVDDVVIKGNTLIESLQSLSDNGNVDVYFIACEKSFQKKIKDKRYRIKHHGVVMSTENIHLLSNYINEYITASTSSYNIDHPIFKIVIKHQADINHFFLNNKVTKVQCSDTIINSTENYSIHYYDGVSTLFPNAGLPDESIVKLRIMKGGTLNANEMLIIPFVLLPNMTYQKIESLFSNIASDGIAKMVFNNNTKIRYENILKYLQYYFSFRAFFELQNTGSLYLDKDLIKEAKYLDSNQNLIFPPDYKDELLRNLKTVLTPQKALRLDIQAFSRRNIFNFNEHLSLMYDRLFLKDNDDRITVASFKEYLEQNIRIGVADVYTISNIIDIFIDRGMIVPTIEHDGEGGIVRAYRRSEKTKFTEMHFSLFLYMLQKYTEVIQEHVSREKENKDISEISLEKTETEKLCVLFFQRSVGIKIFTPTDQEGPDIFCIAFSKFGPLVSQSVEKHKPGKRFSPKYATESERNNAFYRQTRLIHKLTEYGLKLMPNNRYVVSFTARNNAPSSWKHEAEGFALRMSTLRNFLHKEHLYNEHIRTFRQFLTMNCIGYNMVYRLMSLMAELVYFEQADIEGKTIFALSDVMDGIESGLWKYLCYSADNDPLKLIEENVNMVIDSKKYDFIHKQYLLEAIRIGRNMSSELNLDAQINFGIHRCGKILFEIVYYYERLLESAPKNNRLYKLNQIDLGMAKKRLSVELFEKESTKIINRLIFMQQMVNGLLDELGMYEHEGITKCERFYSILLVQHKGGSPMPKKMIDVSNSYKLDHDICRNGIIFYVPKNDDICSELIRIIENMGKDITYKVYYIKIKKQQWYYAPIHSSYCTYGSLFGELLNALIEDEKKESYTAGLELITCSAVDEPFELTDTAKLNLKRVAIYNINADFIVQKYMFSPPHEPVVCEVHHNIFADEVGKINNKYL